MVVQLAFMSLKYIFRSLNSTQKIYANSLVINNSFLYQNIDIKSGHQKQNLTIKIEN